MPRVLGAVHVKPNVGSSMRAALWICTLSALPAVVGAQAAVTDVLERGQHGFGVWAGASLSASALFGKITDRRLFLSGLRYERVLESTGAVTTTYTLDVHPLAVVTNTPRYVIQWLRAPNGALFPELIETSRASVVGAGISPLGVQFYSRSQGATRFFAGSSIGGVWFNREMPVFGARRFNFALQLGGGAEIASRSGGVLVVGYQFHHLSNAGTADANPGMDGHVVYLGVMRRRGSPRKAGDAVAGSG
jgi:hypothetical protein